MMAWVARSRACLAEPPAESPSTRNSSPRSGSWLTQSASLPGSAGPATMRLRAIFWLSLKRCCALAIASMRDLLALVRMLVEPQRERVLDRRPATMPADSRDESRSLVCPANCGSRIFIDSTKLTPSQTSSGESLSPRGTRLRNSQNSRTASAAPARSPLTCVPPSTVGIRLT